LNSKSHIPWFQTTLLSNCCAFTFSQLADALIQNHLQMRKKSRAIYHVRPHSAALEIFDDKPREKESRYNLGYKVNKKLKE